MITGKNIIKLRQAKNLTQKELAERADISLRYLKKIEGGQCPRLKTLVKIANALEAKINDLLDDGK